MDVAAEGASLADHVEHDNIVVLRSFGKFYGLAGLRLSFVLASPQITARLAAALGPWPVSGAALAIGAKALADTVWRETTRASLTEQAARLDGLLEAARLEVIGGTSLFRLVRTAKAERLFRQLGESGIIVRRFAEQPIWLRFGLPGGEPEWQRLRSALNSRG
jgi:cobalamin biosynthetic protein CobC